jgi:hypothetical protein
MFSILILRSRAYRNYPKGLFCSTKGQGRRGILMEGRRGEGRGGILTIVMFGS